MNKVHFSVTAAAILLAVAASGAIKAKCQVQPRAGLWCVCGGTDDFRAFLRRIAGESPVQAFDSPEAMPYDSATNAIFLLLPDYDAGRHVVQELPADVARKIKASQSRGNRFWVECYLSSTNLSRDVNVCGTETYGERPVYFNQEYVEWNGDVLQARRSYYLPAGIRGSGKSCIIKGEAHVSDCIGVHGVHRPGEHRLPATVVSMGGAVVGSLVNITQFDPMFMRPYGLWRTFYASQFGRISGVDTNVVASAFSATWPDFLSPSGGDDPKVALEKALEWHFKSGILNSHDGSKGMSEAVLSDDFGYRRGLRTDSHLLTGALFAAAGVKMNRPEWVKLGRNLVDFMLAEGVQSPEGFYSWFSPREGRAGDEVYSSDMGRDALAMINMYKATGDAKYLESARKAADAFLMWMDGRGLNSGHFSNLSRGGWKVEGTNDNPVFYGEMVSFLLQMDDEKYRDAAIRTIDRISERFPAVAPFHFSDNFTYSRYLVMLACAQYATSRDYSGKINEMLDFFDKYTHRMGGIMELPIRLDDDDEAGVGIGDGTDHIADILYCNNFVFNATSVLVKLPPERQKGVNMEKARRVYGNVRRFLLAAQIKSDDPRFDGAWMRAFDMDIGEYYGLNKDKGWGAYCIESGWVMGFIPAVLLFEDDAGSFFYAHEVPRAGCGKETLAEIRQRFERELLDNVVPFWERHSIDRERGGFITCLDRDGSVYDTFKHLWMQWREVYMFAALWNAGFRERRYVDVAERGFNFLWKHGRNPDGSYHYMLDRDGAVLSDSDGGQEVFTESFAAIGCAELYKATGKAMYRDEAMSAYAVYRRKTADGMGKYDLLAYPMIELNVAQTMRTAFGGYDAEIETAIRRIMRFVHPDTGIMLERAPKSGGFELDTQFGRFVNPGHALEGLSFIMNRLAERPDPKLQEIVLREVRIMGEFGWDDRDGGIWYFRDAGGKPMARHEYFLKAWWPQVEAANAMLQAYALSGDEYFLEFFRKIDAFSWRNLRDARHGEWFAYAPVGGRLYHSYKGSRFKGFFHLPRHLLGCINVIKSIEGKRCQ